MSLSLLKSARVVSALRAAAIAAACMVLQVSSGHAQTPAPEASANPTEILVFEQMRVPRWLTETVVRAAQVTNVDPAYMMALADKESSRHRQVGARPACRARSGRVAGAR
jgi:hypothetical protein